MATGIALPRPRATIVGARKAYGVRRRHVRFEARTCRDAVDASEDLSPRPTMRQFVRLSTAERCDEIHKILLHGVCGFCRRFALQQHLLISQIEVHQDFVDDGRRRLGYARHGSLPGVEHGTEPGPLREEVLRQTDAHARAEGDIRGGQRNLPSVLQHRQDELGCRVLVLCVLRDGEEHVHRHGPVAWERKRSRRDAWKQCRVLLSHVSEHEGPNGSETYFALDQKSVLGIDVRSYRYHLAVICPLHEIQRGHGFGIVGAWLTVCEESSPIADDHRRNGVPGGCYGINADRRAEAELTL